MTNTEIGLVAAGVALVALGTMLWLAFTAPEGWQDADGFHLGREPDEHARDDNLGI